MKTNRRRRKIIRIIVMIIDNISIGMLWAFALTMLVFAIWREMTR